jgi:hypothetical protein
LLQQNQSGPHGSDNPNLVEICIGLEINGYLAAEF